ncbi:hypothetical protein SCLCIDRAFT_6197 [Scleroderma citrinum Foug A]|uniref:Uncharacterized protein n=1 Tax=Scleroderma citrinum Foug A TaxID=1036808 RepID=A0A0C3AZU4_9AGAM|nr:hypothetical protein SCLCIDRAFT_6197 [Scleroderma citrinum Foug A]
MITISSGSNDIPEEMPAGDAPKKTSVSHSEATLLEEQAPSTRKCKVKGPDSPRAMKRATPDRHTDQPKGTHKSSQTRPVTKKTRFQILSPLNTESSDEDKPTVNDPKDHELQTLVTAGDPQDVRPATIPQCDKPSGGLHHDTYKPPCAQNEITTSLPSEGPHHPKGMDSDPPPNEVQKEQHDKGMHSQPAQTESQRAQNEVVISLPSADPRDTGAMAHQSPHAQLEVATVQPAVEIMESGAGLGKSLDNAGAYLPPQASQLGPGGRPRPHQAYGVGQNSDPDEAFTLRRRMYPLLDAYTSTSNPIDSISPASHGLLTAEEGNIGVHPQDVEAMQDPADPTMHPQPSTIGCGNYTNPQPPFHPAHMAEYGETSGGRDPLHREIQPLSPGTEATPNAQPSASTHYTHPDGIAKRPDQSIPK